jgi:hypothetical protein
MRTTSGSTVSNDGLQKAAQDNDDGDEGKGREVAAKKR